LSLAAPDLANVWSTSKISLKSDSPSNQILHPTIEAIKFLITASGHPPDVESVREVDRRLKLCKNPQMVVGSKAYEKHKAEEEKKAEAKRNRKAVEVQNIMDGAPDPFGDQMKRPQPSLVDAVDDDDDD
jgi:cyclin H